VQLTARTYYVLEKRYIQIQKLLSIALHLVAKEQYHKESMTLWDVNPQVSVSTIGAYNWRLPHVICTLKESMTLRDVYPKGSASTIDAYHMLYAPSRNQ